MRRLAAVCLVWVTAVGIAGGAFDEWERRMLSGEHGSAAVYAEGIAAIQATSSVWAYRAAASRSMAGDLDLAVGWLSEAATRGYSGVRTVETDADLDPIRRLDGFDEAAGAVRANAERRLASFRAAAAEAEPVVVRPRGHDASVPTPLVIALHGTGGTGRATARAWRAATQRAGALLVAPDALRPAGNGYSWTFRDESEWYVEHLIENVGEEYAISEVVLVGFSQGANIAFSMGRSHPDLFGAVIPICGHWEADAAAMPRAPAVEEEDSRPSWYLLIGELDPWQGTYDGAFGALGDAGMRVEMKKLPRVGHAMPRTGELLEALRWCLEEKAGEPTRPTRP